MCLTGNVTHYLKLIINKLQSNLDLYAMYSADKAQLQIYLSQAEFNHPKYFESEEGEKETTAAAVAVDGTVVNEANHAVEEQVEEKEDEDQETNSNSTTSSNNFDTVPLFHFGDPLQQQSQQLQSTSVEMPLESIFDIAMQRTAHQVKPKGKEPEDTNSSARYFPQHSYKNWNTNQVVEWMKRTCPLLPQYVIEAFQYHEITGVCLPALLQKRKGQKTSVPCADDDEDGLYFTKTLNTMGIVKVGHILTLKSAIEELMGE